MIIKKTLSSTAEGLFYFRTTLLIIAVLALFIHFPHKMPPYYIDK